MKSGSKGKDGQKAYQYLKEHYLGANNTNLLAAKYEKEIGDLSYTGDKRRWTLEKYINKQVEYYKILNSLKPHSYAGIDTASRVRKLLNGIKCKDLESLITIILAKPDTTFDEATHISKDFLSAYSSARSSSKITQIGAVGGNQSGGGRRYVNTTLQPTNYVQYNKDDPLFACANAAAVADLHNAGSSDGGGGQANKKSILRLYPTRP
jgi:hypothetical protein